MRERPRRQPDAVQPVDARLRPVPLVADDVGQVLLQRAAGDHREHLHAAADAEHRQVAVQRRPHQRHLGGVAVRPQPGRLLVRGLAVQRGVQVGAAGEDHGVQPVQDLGVGGGRGRQDHGRGTRGLDPLDVPERQHHRAGRPTPPSGPARRTT